MSKGKSWEQVKAEALWVLALSPLEEETGGPLTVTVPTPEPPDWLTGEAAKKLARKPGYAEFAPVPPQAARRLVVVDEDGEHAFTFVPDHGGRLVVVEHGRSPDPLLGGYCLGVFSPFGTADIRLDVEDGVRVLRALEQTGSEQVERVIAIDEREPPSLVVEVREPTPAEPWVLRTRSQSFSLGHVTSIEFADEDDS